MALDYATGLEDSPYIDGILGLSPFKGEAFEQGHILPMMREAGVIDNASVSFSLATLESGEESYATFGEYNAEQVVGGEEGLYVFPNFENEL